MANMLVIALFLVTIATISLEAEGKKEPKEYLGWCLKPNGRYENKGTIRVAPSTKNGCLTKCLKVANAKGCEWARGRNTCIVYTTQVCWGSDKGSRSCWVFESNGCPAKVNCGHHARNAVSCSRCTDSIIPWGSGDFDDRHRVCYGDDCEWCGFHCEEKKTKCSAGDFQFSDKHGTTQKAKNWYKNGFKFIGNGYYDSKDTYENIGYYTLKVCIHLCGIWHKADNDWNGVFYKNSNGECGCVKNDNGHYRDYSYLHYRFDDGKGVQRPWYPHH